MAKGARSSANKVNKRALKSRVFGPAELARTQRLSDKLLDLATQPKPSKTEQQQNKGPQHRYALHGHSTNCSSIVADMSHSTDITETQSEPREQGASPSLSIPIPESMFSANSLPLTPPPTPPSMSLQEQDAFPCPTNHDANYLQAEELLFFHSLGVASDIKGFDDSGNLILEFAPSSNVSHNGAG